MGEYVGYIYLTTNTINGKRYIGQHKKPTFDKRYLGSGIILKKSVSKYGRKAFSCIPLMWCSDYAELDRAEYCFIALMNPELNIAIGSVSSPGFKHSAETKEKTRQALLGHLVSIETREKISNAGKGRIQSTETKEKKRIACTGWKQSEEVKEHLRQINTGKKISDVVKEKLRQANLGKRHTPESKEKLRQKALKQWERTREAKQNA